MRKSVAILAKAASTVVLAFMVLMLAAAAGIRALAAVMAMAAFAVLGVSAFAWLTRCPRKAPPAPREETPAAGPNALRGVLSDEEEAAWAEIAKRIG